MDVLPRSLLCAMGSVTAGMDQSGHLRASGAPSGFAEGQRQPAKFLGSGANPCFLPPATPDSVEGGQSPDLRLGFLQPE
jgi:hypothetical protein